MFKFFCLTEKLDDVAFAAAIANAIAKRLNTSVELYVRSTPDFAALYTNINFVDRLPRVLSSKRRVVHADVLEGADSTLYYNLWSRQLRETFIDGLSLNSCMLKIANKTIRHLGLRKNITTDDFLNDNIPAGTKLFSGLDEYNGLICIHPSAGSLLTDNQIATLVSCMSLTHFLIPAGLLKRKIENVTAYEQCDQVKAVTESDIVLATSECMLLSCQSDKNKKTVLLTSE